MKITLQQGDHRWNISCLRDDEAELSDDPGKLKGNAHALLIVHGHPIPITITGVSFGDTVHFEV